mmetsp:Transcript_117158/g.251897  ORF Transcript_117158/g.251897 Transcript_117158/m.251897 type:complete len:105 (-) Transcript_117158:965-1279(-)
MDLRDFAGCGPVHMVGGFCGLTGAIILGPRLNRFDTHSDPKEFKASNSGYCVLGILILWMGWFGFNGGSTLGISGSNAHVAGLVYMNTAISAGFAGLAAFLAHY